MSYKEIQAETLKGWNTWNVRSMLSHVLMPYGLNINIGIKEYEGADYLGEALLGRISDRTYAQRMNGAVEEIIPGPHAYDGSYTQLTLKWKGIVLSVESGTAGKDLCIKIQPIANQKKAATIIAEVGFLWHMAGACHRKNDAIIALCGTSEVSVHVLGKAVSDPTIPTMSPYHAVSSEDTIYIYTGEQKEKRLLDQMIHLNKASFLQQSSEKGELADYYQSIKDALAWNIIYDPMKQRIITPVSRTWSVEWGGYVQHCWDMYFNALMYSVENKELAYISAVEITKEHTQDGFVPNCVAANGFITLDRSQPPVGSMIVMELYKNYGDSWLIEYLFEDLFRWNTWYYTNRQVEPGVLGWGSQKYEPVLNNHWESAGVGEFYGAAMESGLDNSPMYDDVPMNPVTQNMTMADVGLTSLYVADCQALIEMASHLNKQEELQILIERKAIISGGLSRLWSPEKGMYLNYRTDKKIFDEQLSPTNFYPLLTGQIPSDRVDRMVNEHLLNEEEFWGEWVVPSISKDNPAFLDQDYWRGRIWAPMNLLLYLGLEKSSQGLVATRLAEKSGRLIMKEWRVNRHVHENYCAITGDGCNVTNSEKYYSWGALLSYIVIRAQKDDKTIQLEL